MNDNINGNYADGMIALAALKEYGVETDENIKEHSAFLKGGQFVRDYNQNQNSFQPVTNDRSE